MVRGLTGIVDADLLVGLDEGDDAAAVRISDGLAVLATADFFTPVVDDAYDWGRIAAANALSDIYAMGGRPVLAVNLLGWPRDVLPLELAAEVLRGGLDVARLAGCPVAGGHSIDDPEPKYGMAVTGVADPGPPAAQRRRTGRASTQSHQAARRRCAQQPAQGDGRGVPRGRRLDGGPQRRGEPGRPGAWGQGSDRRHGLRAARPPLQAGSGVGSDRRRRRGRRALPRRCARVVRPGLRARGQPAQPRLGAPAPRHDGPTSTSCSCSPTLRRVAVCSSPVRSRGRPSSASSCRGASTSCGCGEPHRRAPGPRPGRTWCA